MPPEQPTPRPGGRTARTTAAVLAATLAELGEHGYQQLTVDQIATRSGVHKTTIYRRWSGTDGLLAAALHEAIATDTWRPADTGSLLTDLTALNEELRQAFTNKETNAIPTAVVAAAFQSDTAATALHAFYQDRYARCEEIVERAIKRNEIPATTNPTDLIRAAVAPIFHRLFISREETTSAHAKQAAKAAIAAAKAEAFTA